MKVTVLFLFFSTLVFGQQNESWTISAKNQLNINKRGMQSLIVWSTSNIIGGTAFAIQTSGKEQAFHLSNALWNTVNLTLGTTGLIQVNRTSFDSYSSYFAAQQKVERIFLINFGLDFLYMSTGLALIQSNNDRKEGIGQSLMLQGAYLGIFDGFMYFIHRKNGKLQWKPNLDQTISFELQSNGFNFIIQF